MPAARRRRGPCRQAGVKAEATYLKGQRGPVVSETVVQLSESQARASIAKLRGAVTQCGAGAGNRGAPLRLARLSLPKLGDQTAGLRMTLGTLSTADLVAVRAGTLLLLLSNGGADRPDTGLTVALARKALAKLQG